MAEVMIMSEIPTQSYHAKYYNNKIKSNPEFYEKERQRVAEYIHNRYFTDPEYKAKILQYKKEHYQKKKEAKNSLNIAQV
jgi:hypothetical protein